MRQPTNPLITLVFAVCGAGAGVLLHTYRTSRGFAPFAPPVTLSATLLLLAAAVLTLAIVLRRRVTRGTGGNVDPFAAVRVLAAARAGQFVGALFGGFGAALALSLLSRAVAPPAGTWLPMVLTAVAGVVLAAAGAIAEHLCKLPPGDGEDDDRQAEDPELGPGNQPAFRRLDR